MVSVVSCPFLFLILVLNSNDFFTIQEVIGTRNDGNPEDDLLEKSVENKSYLKLNFNQLLFSTLFLGAHLHGFRRFMSL